MFKTLSIKYKPRAAIVPDICKTFALVQESTAASTEQSSGVGQINSVVGQLSQTTQQNASSSEELAATAEEMSGQAEQLQHTMQFFKLDHAGQTFSSALNRPGGRCDDFVNLAKMLSMEEIGQLGQVAHVSDEVVWRTEYAHE